MRERRTYSARVHQSKLAKRLKTALLAFMSMIGQRRRMLRIATKHEVKQYQERTSPFSKDGSKTNRCWEYPFVLDVLEKYGIAPPLRILDVGCAMNPLMHHLAERGCHITGVDKYDE